MGFTAASFRVHRPVKAAGHAFEAGQGSLNKILRHHLAQCFFTRNVPLTDFECLLQWPRFQLNQVFVIPVEQIDRALGMVYLADNAHVLGD